MAQLSTKLPLDLMLTKWASTLNPVLALPMLGGLQLNNIALSANIPKVINHLLSRLPQGWFLVDKNSESNIWRSSDWTTTTITLTSDVDVTISIWIY